MVANRVHVARGRRPARHVADRPPTTWQNACVRRCTRKLLRLTALTEKLPVFVYEQFFHPLLLQHGLADQFITDKGNEWTILAFTCYFLAMYAGRRSVGRRPHSRTTSVRNVCPCPQQPTPIASM